MIDNRTLFLREFTKELILHVREIRYFSEHPENQNKNIQGFLDVPRNIPKKRDDHFEREFQELKGRMKEKMKDIESDIFPNEIQATPIILETQKPQITHFIPRQIPVIKPKTLEIKPQLIQQRPIQKIQSPQQQPYLITQQPNQPTNSTNIIEKLKGILADPKVIMLECPGPDKFILVKTATRVMTTGIKLSKEDINSITENFSKETKIPIIAGLFKAVKDNLMITAIISEMTGSRFILKKIATI